MDSDQVHSRMHAYEQEAKRKMLAGAQDVNEVGFFELRERELEGDFWHP